MHKAGHLHKDISYTKLAVVTNMQDGIWKRSDDRQEL